MKTLYGLVRGLKRLKRAALREPKKVWRIEIQLGDVFWTALLSEKPCFKVLHEIWQAEQRIADNWLCINTPDKKPIEHSAWKGQSDTAKKLIRVFFSYRFNRSAEVRPDSAISISEEVLR